jgi:hypothetical protein
VKDHAINKISKWGLFWLKTLELFTRNFPKKAVFYREILNVVLVRKSSNRGLFLRKISGNGSRCTKVSVLVT